MNCGDVLQAEVTVKLDIPRLSAMRSRVTPSMRVPLLVVVAALGWTACGSGEATDSTGQVWIGQAYVSDPNTSSGWAGASATFSRNPS